MLFSDLAQCDMCPEPFMPVLAGEEPSHELPVPWCVSLLQQEVVTVVAKVRHHLHTVDLLLNVLQLEEALRV